MTTYWGTKVQSHAFLTSAVIDRREQSASFPGGYGRLESENCKWYSSLPLGADVSLFYESV